MLATLDIGPNHKRKKINKHRFLLVMVRRQPRKLELKNPILQSSNLLFWGNGSYKTLIIHILKKIVKKSLASWPA
jgi:hypothetical protein